MPPDPGELLGRFVFITSLAVTVTEAEIVAEARRLTPTAQPYLVIFKNVTNSACLQFRYILDSLYKIILRVSLHIIILIL